MNDIKKEILNKIKTGKIEKKSPWYFVVKNYVFWLMFVSSVIIGALAFSSFIIHFFVEAGPWHRLIMEEKDFYYVFKSLPIIWLVVLVIFIAVAWFNYKNTKQAYKKHNFLIVSLAVIISLILGTGIYASGAGRKFDQGIQKHLPPYRQHLEENKIKRQEFLEAQGIDPTEFLQKRRIKKLFPPHPPAESEIFSLEARIKE